MIGNILYAKIYKCYRNHIGTMLRNIPSEFAEEIVSYLPKENLADVSILFHLDPRVLQLPLRLQLLIKYRRHLPNVKPVNLNLLIEQSKDFTGNIMNAIVNGYSEVMRLLLSDPRVDPSDHNNYAIILASKNGRLEVVKLLLSDPRVDPSSDYNYAIRMASTYGHLEVVRLLLSDPRVDPSSDNNYAIRGASENGHLEVVRLLLTHPKVDPTANNNYAIRMAIQNGHREVAELLLTDPRVSSTYQQ